MVALPDHLIYEILLLAPVKSLLRFRSLSKQWCRTISSHKFAMDHLVCHKRRRLSHYVISYSYSSASITLYHPDKGAPFTVELPLSDADPTGEFVIRSSCRGLLCVTFSTASLMQAFLWNPVTRQCRDLFGSESEGATKTCNVSHNFALGFDPATDDYKVVRISSTRNIHRPNRRISILSVRTNLWKKVEDQTPYMPIQRAVAVDGHIFWLAKGLQNTHAVLKFVLDRHQLTTIPCPPEANTKNSPHDQISLSLHECGGSIRLVRFELKDTIEWNMKVVWLLSAADGKWSDISSCYKGAMQQHFRGWDGPLGFSSEAAIVIERRADCVSEDGIERRCVGSLFKDPHHILHCESLISPWD